MEDPASQSAEAGGTVEDPPPLPTTALQERSASESLLDSTADSGPSQRRPPPPPSPLTGCYLLIVIGEPHSERHKEIILQKISKGFLSWDVNECHVSLEKELQSITVQSPEGEEARYGERLIQYATENLVTEILIHPQLNTLHQCMKNLLSSFTKHRHIIHAGYTFAGNGSWILQDGTLSTSDLVEALHETEVLRVLKAYENSVTIDVHCAPEGDWVTERFQKEPVSKLCKIRINPGDVMTAGDPAISAFINYLSPFLEPANIQQLLQPTDVVGNIRFTHPTLYVFPGGQGDAALFGINGFNMLVDGGFSRKACFWDFARHLDRLDAVLLTRLNNSTVNGISAVLQRKKMNHVYPQIGHFFCNLQDRKIALSPDGDKDKDSLIVNLAEEGQEIVANLKHLALKPHPCYRDGNQVDPVNLYHKVGHGKLDMYVISPARDSQAVKEFLAKWSANDNQLFSNTGKKVSGKGFDFPIQNLVSICALLVWQPANPNDTITRILFPGSTPQHKIFEGLDKLRHLEFLKHPVCSARSISPSASSVTVTRSLSKTRQPEDRFKLKTGDSIQKDAKSALEKAKIKSGRVMQIKSAKKPDTNKEVEESKLDGIKKIEGLYDKDEKIENITKEIQKIRQESVVQRIETEHNEEETEKQSKKVLHRSKYDMRNVKSKVDSRAPSKSIDRKKAPKMENGVSPPITPKKAMANGVANKIEKSRSLSRPSKSSPSATPGKSVKEANNRKVVEARVISRTTKLPPKTAKEASPSPALVASVPSVPSSLPASAKTERKPISRRPKAISPAKKAALSPVRPAKTAKPELDSLAKKMKKKIVTELDKTDSTVSTPSADVDGTLAKKEENVTEVEIAQVAQEAKTDIGDLTDTEAVDMKYLTENKETDEEAVKEIEKKSPKAGNIEIEMKEDIRNEEEGGEEEEYLIVTKEEEVRAEDGEKEIEYDSQQEDVKTKDETEGEGEIKKIHRDEEDSEKKRMMKEVDQPEGEQKEKIEDEEIAEEEQEKSSPKSSNIKEEKEQDMQKVIDAEGATEAKEPVSKEQKEGESLPEEKFSATLETSTTTAPTLPEDEKICESDKEEKEMEKLEPVQPEEEAVVEKHLEEELKAEICEEKQTRPEQPTSLVNVVAPAALVEPPQQKVHPRDLVKTPDEVADLPVHEEVDPGMYGSGEFNKDLVKKQNEVEVKSDEPDMKEEFTKTDFKGTEKGEAILLDEEEKDESEIKKMEEDMRETENKEKLEDEEKQNENAVLTNKYLDIIDQLEMSNIQEKVEEEEEEEDMKSDKQNSPSNASEEVEGLMPPPDADREVGTIIPPSSESVEREASPELEEEKLKEPTPAVEEEEKEKINDSEMKERGDVKGLENEETVDIKDKKAEEKDDLKETEVDVKVDIMRLEKDEMIDIKDVEEKKEEICTKDLTEVVEKEEKEGLKDLREVEEIEEETDIRDFKEVEEKEDVKDLNKIEVITDTKDLKEAEDIVDLKDVGEVEGKEDIKDLVEIERKEEEAGKELKPPQIPQVEQLGQVEEHLMSSEIVSSSRKDTPEIEIEVSRKSSIEDKDLSQKSIIDEDPTPKADEKLLSEVSQVEDEKPLIEKLPEPEGERSARATPEKEEDRPSTPEKLMTTSSPTSTTVQESQISGKITPVDGTVPSDSGKISPVISEKDVSGKVTPVPEGTSDLPAESGELDSTISVPETTNILLHDESVTPEMRIIGEEIPETELGEEKTEERPSSIVSEAIPTGKDLPPVAELVDTKVTVLEVHDESESDKRTPDLPEDKEVSREATPEVKEGPTDTASSISGKGTPISLDKAEDDASHRSTPIEQLQLEKTATPVDSGKGTPIISGKSTPEKHTSGVITPDKEYPLDDSSQVVMPEEKLSGKASPEPPKKDLSSQGTTISSEMDVSENITSVSGKESPVLDEKDNMSDQILEDTQLSGKVSPAYSEKELSQKDTLKDTSHINVAGEIESLEKLTEGDNSERATPEREISRKILAENDISGTSSQKKDTSGKTTPEIEIPNDVTLPADSQEQTSSQKKGTESVGDHKPAVERVSLPSGKSTPLETAKPSSIASSLPESPDPSSGVVSPSGRDGSESGKASVSGKTTPMDKADTSMTNGIGGFDEELEKGTLESERHEKESQIVDDISSGEEEELKALQQEEDADESESEEEITRERLQSLTHAGIISRTPDSSSSSPKKKSSRSTPAEHIIQETSSPKGKKDDINNLVKSGGDSDNQAAVKRMLVTASSEDGGGETEICPQGSIRLSRTEIHLDKEAEPKSSDEENKEDEFGTLISRARKEYDLQRSRLSSTNTAEHSHDSSEEHEMDDEAIESEGRGEFGSLIAQAQKEYNLQRSRKSSRNSPETEETARVSSSKTTSVSRSESSWVDENDPTIIITTILTEEREEQEDGSVKVTKRKEVITKGGKEEGTVVTVEEERESGTKVDEEGGQSSTIISEDPVSIRGATSTRFDDYRGGTVEMSPLKTTYITSDAEGGETLATSTFYGPAGREEEILEYRREKGYESFTEIGSDGEMTEKTYFYTSDPDMTGPNSAFMKGIPEPIPEAPEMTFETFPTRDSFVPEDFAKAMDEHRTARGEDIGHPPNGKKDTTEQEGAKEKDVLEGWGKPLGLPLPPKNARNTTILTGQNISATSSLSTPTDNSDSVTHWGHPMNLPSPMPPTTQNGGSDPRETPKKDKKAIQTRKNDNKSSGSNTPNRTSESPVKQAEKRAPSVGRSKTTSPHLYLDLTYVPHHGNSYYSNVEFFKRVRARYYVFSGTEPSKEVYNALLEAKQTWEDKDLEVTIIPTYDTDILGYWVAENEEILAKNKIDLSPSASRCTINLQDHETSCSAYRLEF